MEQRIKELMNQGLSRKEVFEQLKPEAGNDMRLAQRIATLNSLAPSRFEVWINRILLSVCVLQSGFAVWAFHSYMLPLDEEFAWQGIVLTVVLTLAYLWGLAKRSFKGYASFILFCLMVAATYVYLFDQVPIIAMAGIVLATAGGALGYFMKARLFPHMGFMDVRKDENGHYVLE